MALSDKMYGKVESDRLSSVRPVTCAWRLSLTLTLLLVLPMIVEAAEEMQKTTLPDEKRLFTQVQEIPEMLENQQLTARQIPNPHWRADGCPACHAASATKTLPRLRDKDIDRLCNVCHDALSSHSYIHPVAMPLPGEMARRAPQSFQDSIKRAGGKVTCITCHDLPAQCLPRRAQERKINPFFFRDGPYRDRTELCYRCHDDKAYARLNPHDQIGEQGRRRDERCLVCHEHVPTIAPGKPAEVDFSAQGDLTVLCTGCHSWVPHPGGSFVFWGKAEPPNHLVVPSPDVARRMKQQSRALGITLPLDPNTGKLYCGTCHNVHARGVLQGAAAHGAESKSRLRTPEMCEVCHEK